MNPLMTNDRALREAVVIGRFLESPDEESFAHLFRVFTPQLVAFFRSRGCEFVLSEDLTQEVMLTVYRKAAQLRDRSLFRAWLFKIARNALCSQYGKQSREVETVDLENIEGCLDFSAHVGPVVLRRRSAVHPPWDYPSGLRIQRRQWLYFLLVWRR